MRDEPSEGAVDAGCDAGERLLRELRPDLMKSAETWREIAVEKPKEAAELRRAIAVVQQAAITHILTEGGQ